MFQQSLNRWTFYSSLNRLKKGIYKSSFGIMRFAAKVIEPALLKE